MDGQGDLSLSGQSPPIWSGVVDPNACEEKPNSVPFRIRPHPATPTSPPMPDGSQTPLTDAALPPDPGVRTILSPTAINGSIPAGHDTPSPLPIPHAPPEIADRLLAEGAVIRRAARASLVAEHQSALGQYFTPMWVAHLMAAMCETNGQSVRVLDPGAGAGTLFTAFAACVLARGGGLRSFSITAFELDPALRPFLERSARAVRWAGEACRVPCDIELRQEDFVEWGTRSELGDLFSETRRFDAAILNPPYKKLSAGSDLRGRLDQLGIAAPNLYAAFLGLAVGAIRPGGVVVAIVPRSFCNGTYFKRFRRYLLDSATIDRVHLFANRDRAFGQDSVPPGERGSVAAKATRQGVPCVAVVQRGQRNRSHLEPAGRSG